MSQVASRNPRKGEPGYVPRPANCFFLFRKYLWEAERAARARGAPGQPQNALSRSAGELWKDLPDEQKQYFRRLARIVREQHKKDHPDYKFRPQRRKKTADKGAAPCKGGRGKKKAAAEPFVLSPFFTVVESSPSSSSSSPSAATSSSSSSSPSLSPTPSSSATTPSPSLSPSPSFSPDTVFNFNMMPVSTFYASADASLPRSSSFYAPTEPSLSRSSSFYAPTDASLSRSSSFYATDMSLSQASSFAMDEPQAPWMAQPTAAFNEQALQMTMLGEVAAAYPSFDMTDAEFQALLDAHVPDPQAPPFTNPDWY